MQDPASYINTNACHLWTISDILCLALFMQDCWSVFFGFGKTLNLPTPSSSSPDAKARDTNGQLLEWWMPQLIEEYEGAYCLRDEGFQNEGPPFLNGLHHVWFPFH